MKFQLHDSIAYLINITSRSIRKRLINDFQKAGYDISGEQWSILIHLWNKDGQYQFELAELLNKDKTTITRLINELENKKLVIRKPDQDDKRLNHICLTQKGKTHQKNLIPIAQSILDEIEEKIGSKRLETSKKVLRQINAMF